MIPNTRGVAPGFYIAPLRGSGVAFAVGLFGAGFSRDHIRVVEIKDALWSDRLFPLTGEDALLKPSVGGAYNGV
jgi:hypothetical protein